MEPINEGPPPPDPNAPGPFAEPHTYSLADLETDRHRKLVPVAGLPYGNEWGQVLNRFFGGGLAPGDVVTIGAGKAGAGKTAFTMQLADGLALRCAQLASRAPDDEPLTPVLVMSEMDQKTLARRTIARFVEQPARMFRSGAASRTVEDAKAVDAAYLAARGELDARGKFGRMRPWMRLARPVARGADVLREAEAFVGRWREEIAAAHPGREVLPIVVVDPIHRWQSQELSEVEALNELAETLDVLADKLGWIVLITSDTNKDSAKGKDESNAGIFRGSYRLMHACEVALVLKAAPQEEGERTRAVDVELEKNRLGPSWGSTQFKWAPASGLFTPETPEEHKARWKAEKAERAAEKAEKATKAKTGTVCDGCREYLRDAAAAMSHKCPTPVSVISGGRMEDA